MSKNITAQNLMNLWGKQGDTSISLTMEPQRTDLYMVDLQFAANKIGEVIKPQQVPRQYPQFVRSISFPEVKLKAEPIRRASIAYNMPSWDDPVDPVKIIFVVDTHDGGNQSDVCDLLDVWIALSRAGRGSRSDGYPANATGYFLLDASYSVHCRFDIYVSLLRGVMPSTQDEIDAQAIRQLNETAYTAYSDRLAQALTLRPNPPVPAAQVAPPEMMEHTKWVLKNAWCGGYKLRDLSYTETELMTVEATFYVEDIQREEIGVNIENIPVAANAAPGSLQQTSAAPTAPPAPERLTLTNAPRSLWEQNYILGPRGEKVSQY